MFEGSRRMAGLALEALNVSAAAALVRLSGKESVREDRVRWVAGVQEVLAGGYAPAPRTRATFHDAQGRRLRGPSVLGQFFLAVLVAWLVSALPRHRPLKSSSVNEADEEDEQCTA